LKTKDNNLKYWTKLEKSLQNLEKSGHQLLIEPGRYTKTSRDQRKCKLYISV